MSQPSVWRRRWASDCARKTLVQWSQANTAWHTILFWDRYTKTSWLNNFEQCRHECQHLRGSCHQAWKCSQQAPSIAVWVQGFALFEGGLHLDKIFNPHLKSSRKAITWLVWHIHHVCLTMRTIFCFRFDLPASFFWKMHPKICFALWT